MLFLLKEHRLAAGLSLEELAERARLIVETISALDSAGGAGNYTRLVTGTDQNGAGKRSCRASSGVRQTSPRSSRSSRIIALSRWLAQPVWARRPSAQCVAGNALGDCLQIAARVLGFVDARFAERGCVTVIREGDLFERFNRRFRDEALRTARLLQPAVTQ